MRFIVLPLLFVAVFGAALTRPGRSPLDMRLVTFYCSTPGQLPEPNMEDWTETEAPFAEQLGDLNPVVVASAEASLEGIAARRAALKHSHLALAGVNLRRGPDAGHVEVELPADLSDLVFLTDPDERGGVEVALPDKPTEPLRCPVCHAPVHYIPPQP